MNNAHPVGRVRCETLITNEIRARFGDKVPMATSKTRSSPALRGEYENRHKDAGARECYAHVDHLAEASLLR